MFSRISENVTTFESLVSILFPNLISYIKWLHKQLNIKHMFIYNIVIISYASKNLHHKNVIANY